VVKFTKGIWARRARGDFDTLHHPTAHAAPIRPRQLRTALCCPPPFIWRHSPSEAVRCASTKFNAPLVSPCCAVPRAPSNPPALPPPMP
jgi:hypothetical protein